MLLKNNPVIYLTKEMWKYSKGNRHNVVIYFILFTIANLIQFLNPLVIAKMLNIIQEKGITNESFPAISIWLSLLVGLTLAFWLFHGPARVIENKNSFIVRTNYKKYLIDGTMDLPAEWHTDHHSGGTIDKIEKATSALFDYSGSMFMVISSVIKFVSSFIALVYFNFASSYIVIFMISISIPIILKFDKILVKDYKNMYKLENEVSAKVFDIISNITTVIILRIEKLVSSSIYKKIISPLMLFMKTNKLNEVKWFAVSLCVSIMTFLVLFSYIYGALKSGNVVLFGTIFALYSYVGQISDLFYEFAWRYGEIVRQKTRVENVKEVSDLFIEKPKIRSILNDKRWNELKISNLYFAYSKNKNLNLNNINLVIKRKEKIAFIGPSGSGKTTMLKIMRDLYQPLSIELKLDDVKLKYGFKSISEDISLIPQEPEIFSTTIKENISLGINNKIEEIRKYTNMAKFTDVVKKLQKKWNSSINEKGVNLSGGEKQRLALSRGLMFSEDKSVILLDEPTSSVDFKNELEIYKNIFSNFKNKTIISTVHKLHLLPLFDKIYLFKKGQIIASGSFNELLESSKEFKKIWEKHKGGRFG